MSQWKNVSLTDVSVKIGDGLHGTPTYDESGDYYFINGNNLLNGRVFIKPETKKISKAEFDKIKKDLNNSTILLSINGTIGNVSKYTGEKCALSKSVCYINLDENLILRDYFYYECLSDKFQSFMDNIATGTTITNVPLKGIRTYEFKIPPIAEQRAIVSVLSSLDNKIDLLHRQNKTLESMAETIFRQWFIEEAQEDWPETTIGEVFTLNGGSTPSTKNDDFWDGDISWTSPRDLSASESIFLMSTERKITSLGLKRISSGLLPVRTLLMSSRAPIGYLSITDIPVAINQGYIAIRESSHYHSEYMYLWCKLNMEIIKNSGNGSVFQEISKSSFRNLTFIEPPKEKVQSFNELTRDLFEKNRLNTKQIRRLEKLRNTLLPKLMSGEVRVKYAEEAIASVA
ncbi:MAG: restriction endonuclease subunit S [Pantoea dispersa]